jgi:hypothetical protein
MAKKFALNLFNGKKIKRPMAQFKSKHAVLLTLRSVRRMQCTQCNARNTMQCT